MSADHRLPPLADTPLFDRPWNKPVAKEIGRSLESSFRRFHRENPHVLRLIIEKARARKADGETRAGVCLIVEELRHDEQFKMPNAHKPFYARLAMYRAPDLEGFFNLARQNQETPFDPSTVED